MAVLKLKSETIEIPEITNVQPLTMQLALNWSNSTITTMAYSNPREIVVKNIKAINCPCCGAPISKATDHNCDYCGMYLSLEREEI